MFASTSPAAGYDRGLIHQLLIDLGVGSNTAHTVQVWASGPSKVLAVVVIALILTRVEVRLARRAVNSLRMIKPFQQGSARGAARAETLAGVLSAILRTIIWVLAGLTILSYFGLHLSALFATATVIGAGVAFGAQSLIKDFLSGLLILAEDQYGVGDSIVVDKTEGTVEGVTLRVTRIRSVDGVVWYVPNGEIRKVGNNSEGDSQALVEVMVPLGTDLIAAGRVAEEEARSMATDPTWSALMVGEPNFAGVTEVTEDGATMRVVVRTAPGVHLRVARELRLRILEGVRKAGLAWTSSETDVPAPGRLSRPET